MKEKYLLAIDVGTQSIRAIVFNLKGEIVDYAKITYDCPYLSPSPGLTEQDPLYYWDKLCEVCNILWKQDKVSPESIKAMSMTTQRGTVINLDKNGEPLRKAMVWLDQRRAKDLPSLGILWDSIFKVAGLNRTLHSLQAEAEVNWIRENEPEIWENTEHFLFLSGYLLYKLTGKILDSVSSQVGYVPFDYKNLAWSKDNHWKWKALPVSREKLPKLIPPGEVIDILSKKIGAQLGLPEGTPIISAGSDKAMEVVGSGCLYPNQGCIGYGTTATININSGKYIEPIPLLPAYPSGKNGTYNIEVQIYRGFWMVTWFIEQFTEKEREEAKRLGVPTEVVLEEMIKKVPPGSMGLTLQPYWSPGIIFPSPEAKGSIIGFGDVHKKEHIYRAIIEGLAYSIREGKELIERRSKVKINEIYINGGGSKSDEVLQITADILGIPVYRPEIYESSGLGAAILAAVGVGFYPDIDTAVKNMTRVGKVFHPNPTAVKMYDDLYKNVYLKMYKNLKPLYKSIQSITNYPTITK
ncbi:MAG: FGGY-family carbohydrate kinase [Vulcanibacillus sp.]